METEANPLTALLLSLSKVQLRDQVQRLQEEYPSLELIEAYIVPALEEIGDLWSAGELALSQVYMSGRICEELVAEILPAEAAEWKTSPRIAVTAFEDHHFLGKQILCSVLRAAGYRPSDYHRTSADELISRVNEDGIDVLMVSVLMLSSALRLKSVCERLKNSGIKIIVGGAPFRFDRNLYRELGADRMGMHASDAVLFLKEYGDGNGG
jgi:methanogenic corrinoid protein MtbC1